MAKSSAQITLYNVIDIKATYRYYLLQGSTLAKPSKPTAYPPPATWNDAEPSYTSGSTNSLYFVDCTVFSNGTFSYSEVSLSSSYEAAKEAYNRAVNAQNTADSISDSLDVIVGTQTAVTGSWTGVAKFAELKDGQRIAYWLPYNGSGNATLNLTLSNGKTTGAINCYYGGTTRLTTHYPAGNVIHLTYREKVSIAGSSATYTGWWADANYNADTYDRIRYSGYIKAGSAITSGNIIVGKNGTYSHLKTGASFDVSYPILYANAAVAASATSNWCGYLAFLFTVTTTQAISLTAYKPVYIKGKLSGSLFTPVSTTPLTQTVPTSADGYQYILLGNAHSNTTQMYLLNEHPIFQYYNGAFKTVQQIAAEAADAAAEAKGIANGKNTVYYQTSKPSGGTYADDDVWFDTKNGGIYIYKNSEWTVHEVGSVSIKDGSITADKILVTTALVNALFAKDITATGTITGAKLIGAILSGEAIDISSEGTSPDGMTINTRIYTVIDTKTKGTTGVRIECRYGTTKQVAALDVSDGLVAVEGTFLAAGLASLYDLELGAPAQEKLLSYVKPVQKQLWSGTKQMTDTDTVTLSQKISAQNNGIILVFSVSSDGTAANNWGYQSFFISKWLVAAHSGVGHTFLMNSSISFDSVGSKYLYIADTTIKGHEKNTASGTGGNSGIKYNNSKFMLRYVYGI